MNELQQFIKKHDKIRQFKGVDSNGNAKIKYVRKVYHMSLEELLAETEKVIKRWIRMKRTKDNPYFWKMNACYFVFVDRNKQKEFHSLYQKLHRK
ncbi:MAG: hypothetical protein ACLFUH_11005 [Bacteroidales bacterium]